MHPHRLTEFFDKALKMRECEKRMEQQKIKMEDRSRFMDECVWAKAK
jgi:hypothetical protein